MPFKKDVNRSTLLINNPKSSLSLSLHSLIAPSALLLLSSHYANTQLIYEILKSQVLLFKVANYT